MKKKEVEEKFVKFLKGLGNKEKPIQIIEFSDNPLERNLQRLEQMEKEHNEELESREKAKAEALELLMEVENEG